MSDAKLIIRKESKGTVTFKPVQLYVETHELVADLAEETGIPKAKLIDMMVKFAVEHMEIVGGENDER